MRNTNEQDIIHKCKETRERWMHICNFSRASCLKTYLKKKKKTDDHRDILLDKLRTSKEKENGHNELRNG